MCVIYNKESKKIPLFPPKTPLKPFNWAFGMGGIIKNLGGKGGKRSKNPPDTQQKGLCLLFYYNMKGFCVIMTIDELVDVLNDRDVSIHWDGLRYSLYLRNIPRAFFANYQRIDSLHTAGILDDEAAANAIMKLAEKYKGEVSDSNV